jgi:hypothetical protein
MEIRIGVQETGRDLLLESTETPEAVTEKIVAALKADGILQLEDDKGRRVLVPVAKLAYVEIAAVEARRVGFGG